MATTWRQRLQNTLSNLKLKPMETGFWVDAMARSLEELSVRSGGGDVESYFERTYEEIKALKDAGKLIPGAKYCITNYVTKYLQPYTWKVKFADIPHIGFDGDYPTSDDDARVATRYEMLVVTATSSTTFAPICSSRGFPEDIVYYDFDDDTIEIRTAMSTYGDYVPEDQDIPRRGFIRRRIDTKRNIDITGDWRTMLWARFKWDGAPNNEFVPGISVYVGQRITNSADNSISMVVANGVEQWLGKFTFNAWHSSSFIFPSWTYIKQTFNVSNLAPPNFYNQYAERYTLNMDNRHGKPYPTNLIGDLAPFVGNIKIGNGVLRTQSEKSNTFGFDGSHNIVLCFYDGQYYDDPSSVLVAKKITIGEGCHDITLTNPISTTIHNNVGGIIVNSECGYTGSNYVIIEDRVSDVFINTVINSTIKAGTLRSIFNTLSKSSVNACLCNINVALNSNIINTSNSYIMFIFDCNIVNSMYLAMFNICGSTADNAYYINTAFNYTATIYNTNIRSKCVILSNANAAEMFELRTTCDTSVDQFGRNYLEFINTTGQKVIRLII